MKCLDFILKAIFPPHCLACGTSIAAGAMCKACLDGIPRYQTFFCANCGARLPGTEKVCHPSADYILGSGGPYDNAALKLLIHHLKFRGVRDTAEPLADLLAHYLADIAIDTSGFLLIPLPMHRKRWNERGFNQTEEIARCLAKRLPLRIRSDILARNRHAKPQTKTANAAERRRNIIGCFSVVKPDDIRRKDIILLDDVTTSGATLGEAARTLKAAGARKIIGLTAAKA
jgi:ComF family protein